MNSTASRWVLLVTAITLGAVALETHVSAVLRSALVIASVVLLVTGMVVRPPGASASAPGPGATSAETTAARARSAARTGDGSLLDQPAGEQLARDPGGRGDGPPWAASQDGPPVVDHSILTGESAASDSDDLDASDSADPAASDPEDPTVSDSEDPTVSDSEDAAAAPPVVRLDLGRDDAGRPVVVSAAEGVAVTGSGALAEAVHLALAARLLSWSGPADELRCVGVAPEGRPERSPVERRGEDRRADGAVTGADTDVDVATLVGPQGELRGVLVRSRDTDRPRAVGTVVSVGRAGCRVTVGGAEPVRLDPVLPGVGTGAV